MTNALLALEILLSAIAGYAVTRLLIYYSIKHSLIDIANSRSSHKTPTPRIGGISFTLLISLTLILSHIFKLYEISDNLYLTLLVPPLMVAFVSLVDDMKGGISRRLRLIFHALAVAMIIYLLQPPPQINAIVMAAFLLVIALAIVWIINLYNFMDGIDGIAASEAIFIIAASAGFALLANQHDWAYLQVTLLGPLVGFLLLNWQPAKTFMGDIGSTYLGALLSCILAISLLMGTLNLWSALIIGGTFLVDASWTLFYRLITGQKWYHPHRSHCYQIASRKMDSHAKTSLWNIALNIGWLWPLSYCANTYSSKGIIFTGIALLPLLIICIINKAGAQSSN